MSETDDFDSPWKEALSVFFREFLKLFFPIVEDAVNWNREIEFLDKEFQQIISDAKLGRSFADMLLKAWLKNGDKLCILVHVEVQGRADEKFPERMYVYSYRAYDKHRLPVLSIAVLADESQKWRPNKFEYNLFGCRAGLRYKTVKLSDYAAGRQRATLERSDNPFALLVLAHLKTQETKGNYDLRSASKLEFVRRLIAKGWPLDSVRQLFRMIDWMMRLPDNMKELFREQVHQIQEENKMPFIDCFEELGIEKGMAKGMAKALRETIIEILAERFGKTPPQLSKKINAIEDIAVLKSLRKSAVSAKTLREFTQRVN